MENCYPLLCLDTAYQVLHLEQNLTKFPARKKVDEKACANGGVSMLGMSEVVQVEESPETIKSAGDDLAGAVTNGGDVYVSQVAAAVAALHERSMLEMKIRGLRLLQRPMRYQLTVDAIIKESSKTKTREEFLAEERDCKRRRMSYRRKKLKQSSKEVMRDIIEEYTEKIRKAGGIGCFGRSVESEGLISSKPSSFWDSQTQSSPRQREHLEYQRRAAVRKTKGKIAMDTITQEVLKAKTMTVTFIPEVTERKYHGREYYSRNLEKKNQDGDYYSESPELYTSHGHSYEHTSHQREQDDAKTTRTKHYKSSQAFSQESKHQNDRSFSPATESTNTGFEDRYDPSESRDGYDNDDVSHGSSYRTPDEYYN
ncbi:hypothetical protein RJ641_020406 [Dillenia turbinata]|uniref:Uncharacterized protein n=1 Tax=Dillenia turbinata TaxID=194707 RepID=A0AAN8UM18_9MAGN